MKGEVKHINGIAAVALLKGWLDNLQSFPLEDLIIKEISVSINDTEITFTCKPMSDVDKLKPHTKSTGEEHVIFQQLKPPTRG